MTLFEDIIHKAQQQVEKKTYQNSPSNPPRYQQQQYGRGAAGGLVNQAGRFDYPRGESNKEGHSQLSNNSHHNGLGGLSGNTGRYQDDFGGAPGGLVHRAGGNGGFAGPGDGHHGGGGSGEPQGCFESRPKHHGGEGFGGNNGGRHGGPGNGGNGGGPGGSRGFKCGYSR